MIKIEDLYEKYKEDTFYYLLSLTHNSTLSEDLLSETFLHAIRSLPNYKGKSSIKTWIFGIARNMWLQNLRKSKDTVQYDELLAIYLTHDIEEHFIQKQAIDRIYELLKSKDDRIQSVVNMRIDGFSYYDIGLKLCISENSARVIDFRTKKWIKTILEAEGLV
ncbi:MAG: sigma-70 family RNA polymerase sigma factor [Clostridium sp.]|uniref:RNA polymerase sigma factor n=1 Tax=Clostridium sp. TaxID=1506 RepID=UPI00302979BE